MKNPMKMSPAERFTYYYSDVDTDEFFVVVYAAPGEVRACGGEFPNMTDFGDLTLGLSKKLSPVKANILRNADIHYAILRKGGARQAIEAAKA
jgi:hypothetical protein